MKRQEKHVKNHHEKASKKRVGVEAVGFIELMRP
jgi:hypothetical protein